jgi:hypothetical protein
MEKTYEVVKCECGHECPADFAIKTSGDTYDCPICVLAEMLLKIKTKNKQLSKLKKKLRVIKQAAIIGSYETKL